MIRVMTEDDYGIVANYLYDDYSNVSNGKALVTTLRGIITMCPYKYVLETDDGLLIGYYAYKEESHSTAELSSVFIAPKYRHTKYAKELWVHGTKRLKDFTLVKCYTSYDLQLMPVKYYNRKFHIFDFKKLAKRVL